LQKQVDIDEPEEEMLMTPLAAPSADGVEAAAPDEMVEMSEDDILAALQSLENAGPKDRGDGRDD
ncbi:hypothetical protein N9W39_02095, partial [Alphaproteobacteria bacterium]|nr:hypothetical protein [Alphaproteobacteria bacterium]